MNLLGGAIPLGRWFGVQVGLSWTFFLAVLYFMQGGSIQAGLTGVGILFGIVLLHEFGHVTACRLTGGRANAITLGALGGVAYVDPPPKAWAHLVTTLGGPLVNVVLAGVFYALDRFAMGPLVDAGYLALVDGIDTATLINVALLAFNLLPIFPLDGGRLVQNILWFFIGYPQSLMFAGMTGVVGGIAFIGLGLGLWSITIPMPWIGLKFTLGRDINPMLAFIGLMGAMNSWMVYQQARQIQGWRKW